MTANPQTHHLPQKWAPDQRVFGGPLQEKIRLLMEHPRAPSWARLVRDLGEPLEKQGLNYHPRTLKRQLNGKITYVPAGLEHAFEKWIDKKAERYGKTWVKKIKSVAPQDQSEDDPLIYVPVKNFQNLAQTYLEGHPGLSRRKLALLLQKNLAERNFDVGMEAIQSAVAGKTQRVRRIYEQALAEMVENMPPENERTTPIGFLEYGDATDLPQAVDAILEQNPGLSRRKIASLLREELASCDIAMSLNSLQVILSGKTQKTRRIILDLIATWQEPHALRKVLNRHAHLLSPAGRRNLEIEVNGAWQEWHEAHSSDKEILYQKFLELRQGLLRERWLHRQRKKRGSGQRRKPRYRSQNPLIPPEEEEMENSPLMGSDLDISRLVS